MRQFLLAVLLLPCISYALIAQNRLPQHINFDTAFTIPANMTNRFFFSDTSYHTGKTHLMWNNANGVPHTIDEYYHINARLGDIETDVSKSPQSLCVRDTNYHLTLRSIFNLNADGAHSGARSHNNPLYGIALHYDVCAPNRTRSIPGTNASYQETYPDWTDPSGGAFGFLSRNSGTDSVFADGNKQRVYRANTISPGTIILSHPYPNDEYLLFS